MEDLENDYLQGNDNFPKSLTAAYNLLANWKQDPRHIARINGLANDGVTFANIEGSEAETALVNSGDGGGGRTPRDKSHITCFNYGKKGHYASECKAESTADKDKDTEPDEHATGSQMLIAGVEHGEFDDDAKVAFQFTNIGHGQREGGRLGSIVCELDNVGHLPREWILLDNQSTIDVFQNAELLTNIRKNTTSMDIHCNAGEASTDLVGDLPGYGTVWYHPDRIANILSLARVKQCHRVTFNSDSENQFVVHKDDGTERHFKESERGLYYMDTSLTGTLLVNTVAKNKSKYTNADYSCACLARKIQKMIGRPSTRTFIKVVENNLLPNCPITQKDIAAAEDIFGPDVGSLKGKTTWRAPDKVRMQVTPIPAHIMSRYKDIDLTGDVMRVNKIPFFVTISRSIKFSATNTARQNPSQAIKQVHAVYMKRGFRVKNILLDGQFECLRGDLSTLGITVNVVSNDEHVPDIERYIRTVKERTCCVHNTLPFRKMLPRLIIEMVYASVFWLNCFPVENGVSSTHSPCDLIVGLPIDYNKHCGVEFGTYVQVHEEHDNLMVTRTTGAMTLRPTTCPSQHTAQ